MKKSTVAIITTLGVYLLSTHANSASFDCKKATTWVEKTICENPELSNLDEAMAKKYKVDLTSAADYEDSQAYKDGLINSQRTWLKFQRNTCKDTSCLIREYKEYIEEKSHDALSQSDSNKPNRSDLPSKNAFGKFSESTQISVYNSDTERWDNAEEAKNSISIHKVANKPYLAIIDGILIFTNAHTCEIEVSKATWSQNHWVISDEQQNEATELHLYPASHKGKTQLVLTDPDNQFREQHCGMRGYFDGIVLERE
ncbi:MAG: lysozyme inhibitor LprI family protein [Psychrobacter sp.]